MPIIMLILSVVGGALWFWVRSNPRDAIDTAADIATTVRNAPRRLAFRKQTNAHPVEGVDDPNIAICAIAQAFIELDDLPTIEQRQKLHVQLRVRLRTDEALTEEMEVLGRWLVTQCGGAKPAITRLGRRLFKLDGGTSWTVLQDLLPELVDDGLSADQIDAVDELKRALRH
jgi:hypothetical protein